MLYGTTAQLEAMPPFLGGGDMISSVTFEKSTWNVLPYKFEAGTPHIEGAVGLAAAMRFIRGIGFDWITAHESALLAYGTEALPAVPGVRLVGTAPDKASILSFVIDGVHPHDIGTIVDQHGRGHSHRPPLRAAGDGALRHPGHRARVAGDVQHHRRRRPARSRRCTTCGRMFA